VHTLDLVSPALGAAAMLAVGLATGLPAALGWPVFAAAIAGCALVMRLAGPIPGVFARRGRAPSPAADTAAAVALYGTLAFTALAVALLVRRLLA
jgi:hypothetical protein